MYKNGNYKTDDVNTNGKNFKDDRPKNQDNKVRSEGRSSWLFGRQESQIALETKKEMQGGAKFIKA